MREIKFRAWDKKEKKMYIDQAIPSGSYLNKYLKEPRGCILMQYTGLKDKNCKEIYEGDCLGDYEDEQWVCYGIITYDEYNGRYFLADKKGYATDYETYENSDWNLIEVIGNIWENKELLK